jgi:hypothetical protein
VGEIIKTRYIVYTAKPITTVIEISPFQRRRPGRTFCLLLLVGADRIITLLKSAEEGSDIAATAMMWHWEGIDVTKRTQAL